MEGRFISLTRFRDYWWVSGEIEEDLKLTSKEGRKEWKKLPQSKREEMVLETLCKRGYRLINKTLASYAGSYFVAEYIFEKSESQTTL